MRTRWIDIEPISYIGAGLRTAGVREFTAPLRLVRVRARKPYLSSAAVWVPHGGDGPFVLPTHVPMSPSCRLGYNLRRCPESRRAAGSIVRRKHPCEVSMPVDVA